MKTSDILKDWATVNMHMPSVTEKEALALLEAEKAGAKRLTIMLRLYGRYNKLRTRRERSELGTWSNA